MTVHGYDQSVLTEMAFWQFLGSTNSKDPCEITMQISGQGGYWTNNIADILNHI